MGGLKIAFVGVEKDYGTLDPGYVRTFNKHHLEIPFYFAQDGGNEVCVSAPGFRQAHAPETFPSGGSFGNISEEYFRELADERVWDVVVHWRKWREDLYDPDAINLLHTCDHSYSSEWKNDVWRAFNQSKLRGILCYRTWHKRRIAEELRFGPLSTGKLFTDCTLGVDCEIYRPAVKDPYQLLWASDPGRGMEGAVSLAIKLWHIDRRFKLHLCAPDYARLQGGISPHPALQFHGNIPNGPALWDLFNASGILPYTSTFLEPSSRAHRQAQAAGAMVLYPPDMGSPSELIGEARVEFGEVGVVAPISQWPELILDHVKSGRWKEIGENARRFALTQTWKVQAQNFNTLVDDIRAGRK